MSLLFQLKCVDPFCKRTMFGKATMRAVASGFINLPTDDTRGCDLRYDAGNICLSRGCQDFGEHTA